MGKKLVLLGILLQLSLNNCTNSKIDESQKYVKSQYKSISGIFPHLAYYNNEDECGTGAVVPWAGNLWWISYGSHWYFDYSNYLYKLTPDLQVTKHLKSIGGTPACRMVHSESNQLFIGPYAINSDGKVRVVPYTVMPGRYTSIARHLTDPTNKVYYGTMEEGFYEVDVNTLQSTMLYEDGNITDKTRRNVTTNLLVGGHGKGMYSGQGVLIYSNNGAEPGSLAQTQWDIESGSLSEWDGKAWKLIRRNQFMEVSGPGGIYGNPNPETDPIWVTGYDTKSLIFGVRDLGEWTFYRLPKASHTYDGAHGHYCEWYRIRDIGTTQVPDYMMTIHGMFWRLPSTFTSKNTAGIRPRSAYLKMIGDFCRWDNQLVFGCDDAARTEYGNIRKLKGASQGAGQSNSNLWFTSLEQPDQLGPITSEGAVWIKELVTANRPSEPFLFAGWSKRCVWINNEGHETANFSLEVDKTGNGTWQKIQQPVKVESGETVLIEFATDEIGEWIRVSSDVNTKATAHFFYTDDDRTTKTDEIFNGLAKVSEEKIMSGLLYSLGDNRGLLGVAAYEFESNKKSEVGYYELDEEMKLIRRNDPQTLQFIKEKIAPPKLPPNDVIEIDESSVLIIDDKDRHWRLPLGNINYTPLIESSTIRVCRELITERDLMNCHGTFYELPAESADGFAKIRPIASHNFRIDDYVSYRGMLVMTGINPAEAEKGNPHIILSEDGKAGVWAGVIDDLWKMGKPVGVGGPWKDTPVRANDPSDPYLIGFYDKKQLQLSHNSKETIIFKIEVDPSGHGPWMMYKEVSVAPDEIYTYTFPNSFQARWIRFSVDKQTMATSWLTYE